MGDFTSSTDVYGAVSGKRFHIEMRHWIYGPHTALEVFEGMRDLAKMGWEPVGVMLLPTVKHNQFVATAYFKLECPGPVCDVCAAEKKPKK